MKTKEVVAAVAVANGEVTRLSDHAEMGANVFCHLLMLSRYGAPNETVLIFEIGVYFHVGRSDRDGDLRDLQTKTHTNSNRIAIAPIKNRLGYTKQARARPRLVPIGVVLPHISPRSNPSTFRSAP